MLREGGRVALMVANLTAVREKLARAKKKLDALSEEATAYLDPVPYRFVVETNGYTEAIVCRIDREPNPDWAHELAEIAYQARSSLDLLIRQLVIDSGNTPGRTQFPIFLDRNDYVKKWGRESLRDKMLKGVATRHRRVVDDLQPYQRGRRVHEDPLAVLATVSNRDKHNDIYTAVAAVKKPRFKIARPGLEDLTIDFTGDKFRPYAMADGDELISLNWTPPPGASPGTPNTYVHLEVLEMETGLGFHSDRLVTLTDIDRAVLHVSRIIERFAARIRP